jgi:hypothetical protein
VRGLADAHQDLPAVGERVHPATGADLVYVARGSNSAYAAALAEVSDVR